MTREERNKYLAEWRARNREKIRAQHKAWYEAHKHEEKLKNKKRRFFSDWLSRNKEHRRAYQRKLRADNLEKVKARKRAWYANNREKVRAMRRRELNNPRARIAVYLRSRLRSALLGQRAMKRGKLVDLLGTNIPELMAYLESKFATGMSWSNYGKWHVDHIRPMCSFDLTDARQQREAMHFTNLQPLWAADNLKKSKKYEHAPKHEDLASRVVSIAQ